MTLCKAELGGHEVERGAGNVVICIEHQIWPWGATLVGISGLAATSPSLVDKDGVSPSTVIQSRLDQYH